MGRRLGLKVKLLIFIGAVSFVSILVVSLVSFYKSKEALSKQTENQLSSSGESIKNSLDWFLRRTHNFASILSRDRLVEGLLIAYESSFFGSSFDPGKDLKIDNEFYNKLDAIYGERKAKILKEYELKDLMLVSLDAQVIFTANNKQKDLFLGRNLINGKFKDSPLHKCYQTVHEAQGQELYFTGFDYSEITKSVDGFICGKKLAEFENRDEGIAKGDLIGIIIIQVDNFLITKLLTDRTGMGETGQSYLVGDDYLLRSDFFVNAKVFNAINSMKNKIKIDSGPVKLALTGKKGITLNINANSDEVLTYYQPFEFMNKKYAVITDKSTKEIFESISSTMYSVITLSVILFVVVISLTILVTNSILAPVIKAKELLEQLSGGLKDNAETLQTFSNSLTEGAAATSSAIHEAVSTMNELNEMVNKNLGNVKKTTKASSEVIDSVNKGKGETGEMMTSVNEISNNNDEMVDAITTINQNMQGFKEVIMNISEKTNVINEIVSQTKLLSFNASVEAARAGELGKGFAVVAEEVGNLATASGNAAEEIRKLLNESIENVDEMIQTSTRRVDRVKVETQSKISVGKEKAEACESSLGVIQDQINLMTGQITEIDVASNEQASGIKEVFTAMTGLSETSEKTTQVANDTLKYSNEILERSEDLIQISKDLELLVSGES